MIENFQKPIFGVFDLNETSLAINLNEPSLTIWDWTSHKDNISEHKIMDSPLT